jgi:hypothetical protein
VIGSVRRLAHGLVAAALAAGVLAALSAAPATAADPMGYVIAQGEAECWLASVDLVTGETHAIGSATPEKCAFDLEFSPDGTHLLGTRVDSVDSVARLVEFDIATGNLQVIGQLGDFELGGPGSEQGNLTLPATGGLYTYLVPNPVAPAATDVDPACDGSAFCLFQGSATVPGTLAYVNSVPQTFTVYYGLATSCAGVTSSVRGEESLDLSTGWPAHGAVTSAPQVLTEVNRTSTGPGTSDIGPVGDGTFLSSVDYNAAGALFGVGFQGDSSASLFTIDTGTGAATAVTALNDGTDPIYIGVLGFAIAHPCAPTPPGPPAAQPIAAVAPRFTG